MLDQLFGSKSVEKILLFLLVNEKCYPSQLHRLMHLPLTPLQKGCEKLEQMGVLQSEIVGNTRCYSFNPNYPLLEELEALLKKCYSLLAPREKSFYYYIRHTPQKNQQSNLLQETWKALRHVNHIGFEFYTKGKLRGAGTGTVQAHYDGNSEILFKEKGMWKGQQGEEFSFTNVFKWTMSRIKGMLTLEHLRFGEQNPVFLFHLIPASNDHFESAHAHLCGQDTYFGQLSVSKEGLQLLWRILGPKKNEEIRYSYSINSD